MAIDKKDYKTVQEYNAALKDEKLISSLKSKYNLDNREDVKSLYQAIKSGNIKFESKHGLEFDDYIYELYTNPPIANGKKSKNNKASKKISEGNDKRVKGAQVKDKGLKNNKKELKSKSAEMTPEMLKLVEKELKKQELIRKIVMLAFLVAALIGAFVFVLYYKNAAKSENRWNELADVRNSADNNSSSKTTVKAHLSNDTTVELTVLPKYESLYKTNKKLIGWIQIADTNIDYPVMQCDNNEYYLNHNFDQQEDKVGALFLDYQCDVVNGSDNYIIYGHHLSSGKMFSHLSDYQSESFYKKHQYIVFDTIYEEHKYQVMYAFRSRVYNSDDMVFKYYDFINANSEEEFLSYMQEMSKDAFYDTGVKASYGDTLLTLSTCDYNEKNGRFVVVAKRIY